MPRVAHMEIAALAEPVVPAELAALAEWAAFVELAELAAFVALAELAAFVALAEPAAFAVFVVAFVAVLAVELAVAAVWCIVRGFLDA